MVETPDNLSEKARSQILQAALPHVPFEGWTKKAMRMAIVDADLPAGSDELYFPGGPLELIEFWVSQGDVSALAKIEAKGLHNMRIRDKVTECVWLRLEEMRGNEEAAKRAMARLALPDAAGRGSKQLWSSADMIWRAIGDTSTDGNYYSKRTILSGVLATSIMSWLTDTTEDKSKAREFLEARIGNVMQFEKAKFSFRKRRENWPAPAEILGKLRYGRRRRRSR